MSTSNNFDSTHYINGLGLYINIDDYDKSLKNKILNRATKFLKSNKELKEKILVCFQFDTEDCEYDELDKCCQEAVDAGYNYCPDCGNDVRGIDNNYHPYNSLDDEKIRNLYLQDEEDFYKAYIEEHGEYSDYFDDIWAYSNMYMEENLFNQVKENLEKEGIEVI